VTFLPQVHFGSYNELVSKKIIFKYERDENLDVFVSGIWLGLICSAKQLLKGGIWEVVTQGTAGIFDA